MSVRLAHSKAVHARGQKLRSTDVRVDNVAIYLLPIEFRVPLQFASETVSSITCCRVKVTVADSSGRRAEGWGEVPLSIQWAWPSTAPFTVRFERLKFLCCDIAKMLREFDVWGHALEIGHDFRQLVLPQLLKLYHSTDGNLVVPYLAALMCFSPFDIALHDAYGKLNQRDVYETYNAEYLNRDLSAFLAVTDGSGMSFAGLYPQDFLEKQPSTTLAAWHLVGGADPLTADDLTGDEPDDGLPVLLSDWIARDGLYCLKTKLRGNDAAWDYERLVRVGTIASARDVKWLSADFNCMVTDPVYVIDILDRLSAEHPQISAMLLYVEQPFPSDLCTSRIDVRSVAAKKPVFLDESAHDWQNIAIGHDLGWSGVALKTCKTQTGSLLSLCWARFHGMSLMVQDLTNPMLAQLPHVRLAAHAGTIMGVETNSMQFYPHASEPESLVHPGLYRRRDGNLDLTTIAGSGFGYRADEIKRDLSENFMDIDAVS
jgi:L-alanine-DL-glutamate epimerase-like enolase superfamily enzyme